jgi:hypothetical protein
LEADISFSVMTQDQYDGNLGELKRAQDDERQAQLERSLDKENIFKNNNKESHDGGDARKTTMRIP